MSYNKARRRNSVAVIAFGALAFASTAVFAALPPSVGSVSPTSSAAVNQLVSDAQKALKAENIPLALIHLKNAVSVAPSNGNIRAQLGFALLQYGDYNSAEAQLRQARKDGASDQAALRPLLQVMLLRHEEQALLDEFPETGAGLNGSTAPDVLPDVLNARALALQVLDQSVAAHDTIARSLKLRRDTQGLLVCARIAQNENDFTLAKNLADEAIQLSHGSADPMLFKVSLLIDANDATGALDVSNQLDAKFPNNLAARFLRIEVLMRLKQDGKARAEVDAILAKNPDLTTGVYYKALLLARAGKMTDAWRLAHTLPPDFSVSQAGIALVIAQIADEGGSPETGAAILSPAILKYPDNVGLRLLLARIRLRQDAPADALAALEPIRDSSDMRVTRALSDIYLRLHKYSDALEMMERINQTGSGDNVSERNIGLLEMQLGQSDQGIKDLAKAVAQSPTDAQSVGPFIVALSQSGRFAEALSAADRLGSDPKRRVQGLIFRAQVLLAKHDVEGALATLAKAVQLEPKNVASLYSRATLLVSLKKFGEANRDLGAILAIDPTNLTVQLKLAEIAADQGRDQNARDIIGRAIAMAPKNPAPRMALARYLKAKNDFKNAAKAVNDLLRVQPKNVEGLALLGQTQIALGQKNDAVKTFHRLVMVAPNAAAAQVLLGNALFVAGDRRGAMQALLTATKLNPNSSDVRIAQINLQLATSDLSGAVSTARALQILSPGTPSDIVLADTLVSAKHPEEATMVLKQSLARKPTNEVLMRLARLSVQSGDKKQAIEMMSSLLDKNPNDVALRVDYATLLMQDGNKAEAANQYQAVLKRDPNNVSSLNNLGWLTQREDPRRALALVTSASKLAPNSPDILDTLGWLKLQQKDAAGSLPLLSRAHQLQPKDGDISYHLVMALDANGQHVPARTLLKSLLASGVNFENHQSAIQLSATWH